MSRTRTTLAGVLLALAAVTGCSSNGAAPAAPASTAPPAGLHPPRSGACYRLTVASALKASDTDPAVPCSGPHTSRTIMVATVHPAVPGRRPVIASVTAQRQIADRCRSRVDTYVGGSREAQRLSRVQAVWFSPTPAAAAAGAVWFRCDLVIASSTQHFAPLPRHVRGLLAVAGAPGGYGTCGTAAPGSAGFRRVLCSARHTWRARATIALPRGTAYLGKAAGKHADSQCRDVEASRAVNIMRLRWSFEWPTRAQWTGGQRYGLCWTPEG